MQAGRDEEMLDIGEPPAEEKSSLLIERSLSKWKEPHLKVWRW